MMKTENRKANAENTEVTHFDISVPMIEKAKEIAGKDNLFAKGEINNE